MDKAKDSYDKVLDASIRLSKAVVQEGVDTKIGSPFNAWAIGLLAKITSSSESVQVLAQAGQTTDAVLVLRSILDGLIDLLYITEDPLRQDELTELYYLESFGNAYDRMTLYAEELNISVQELAKRYPNQPYKQLLSRHEYANKHPAFTTGRNQEPKRWRFISTKEKLKVLRRFAKIAKRLDYPIRQLGNVQAHSGPIAVMEFVSRRGPDLSVFWKPKHFFYDAGLVCLETSGCLLIGSEQVSKKWYLDERFLRRGQSLLNRLHRLNKIAPCEVDGTS